MSLRLIYGRAGSGKSYFCLQDIKSKLNKEEEGSLILLVPEQFTLQAERNLIQEVGASGVIRAEVLSFRRLAYRIFNEVGGITRQHVNSAGKCMMLYRIMDKMKEKLSVLSNAAKQQGFVNTICQTISEMKRYNITPEQLRQVSEQLDKDELLKGKLQDIEMIFGEFEKILHERYIDTDDDLTMLTEKLELSKQLENAEIWIDEFSGFTPQEYGVIEKLLRKVKRVNVSLCTDCLDDPYAIELGQIFSSTQATARKLLKIAKENQIAVEAPVAFNKKPFHRFKDSKAIEHLEHNFFAFPYNKYPHPTEDIGIFAAANVYTEVESTARDILRLCRDKGMRYRDIAVVARNLSDYQKLIQVIFSQYDIPYFIDQKRDIENHPLIRLMLSVMDIFIHNWNYESVFQYLKTGLTNIPQEDIDLIENYVLAAGIRGSQWTKEENWTFRYYSGPASSEMSDHERELLSRVNQIRRSIVEPLMNFREKTRGRKTAKEISTALFEFLWEENIPDKIKNRVDEFKDKNLLDLANEYGQIWNIMIEVLDQIVEVMGDEKIALKRFREVLAIGFGEYQIGLIPPALDQVLVGSIERSKSHKIKALYILGVNDGVFPAPAGDEGILSDKDRTRLLSLGVELAQDTRTRAFEEQYLIYRTITTSEKYIRFSYSIADPEGRSKRPSTIIHRIKKIFPRLQEQSDVIQKDTDEEHLSMITRPKSTFNQLISQMRKQVEGSRMNPLWNDVYHWYMQQETWKEKCSSSLLGLSYSNQSKYISRDKIHKLYGSPIYTSVSRLEKFSSCPFAFYLQYGLKAKERKTFQLTSLDLGTFMHKVIDEFSKTVREQGLSWKKLDKQWCADTVSEIVHKTIDSMTGTILNSTQRYQYLTTRLKRVMIRTVWLIVEHIKRSSFEPLGYEISFQEKGDFPPIELELSGGEKIRLEGKIDRVDTLKTDQGTYLRIVDYKSGPKKFKLADVYYGLQIQLIVYLDAIWENGGKDLQQPILPGGILYFRIHDPMIKGSPELLEEEIEKQIMKEFKMKGLILADVNLIREMDHHIEGDSLIIPARINKRDGSIGKSSSVATMEQFNILRKYTKKLLVEMGEEILSGNVSISPYKKSDKSTPCNFCSYSAICQFDPSLADNKYRLLQDKKDEDVWKEMK